MRCRGDGGGAHDTHDDLGYVYHWFDAYTGTLIVTWAFTLLVTLIPSIPEGAFSLKVRRGPTG